jgi:hypothetical protein
MGAAAAPDHAAVDSAAVDLVLALDGTASMKASIAQAKQDGHRLVAALRDVSPDLRVGVVVFRDFKNPAGEYQVLQPLTPDAAAVDAGLDLVRAVGNPDPANGTAESYSLLFRQAHSDPALAWRPAARKVVVVIGDAEPYSAGQDGITGCRSKAVDPHGLKPSEELAAMKARGIVLLMVRQVSSQTTASLGCYESVAQRAALGSAARDGGRADLVGPVVSLMKQVIAPITLRSRSAASVRRGAKVRYVLTLTNRSLAPMRVNWMRTRLPKGLAYSATTTKPLPKRRAFAKSTLLIWHLNRTLAPGRAIKLEFSVRAAKTGKFRLNARGYARFTASTTVADVSTRSAQLSVRR